MIIFKVELHIYRTRSERRHRKRNNKLLLKYESSSIFANEKSWKLICGWGDWGNVRI